MHWDMKTPRCKDKGRFPALLAEAAEFELKTSGSQQVWQVCEQFIAEHEKQYRENKTQRRKDKKRRRYDFEMAQKQLVHVSEQWDQEGKYDELRSRMPPPVSSSSEDEADALLPKFPPRLASGALRDFERNAYPRGLYCAHKHCHNRVPYGKHGSQEAMATNLCKQCHVWLRNPKAFPKFPFGAVAKLEDGLCCYRCNIPCACRNQWGRTRDGTLTERCINSDGITSDCDDKPPLPDRDAPLPLIAEYDSKVEDLERAVKEEAEEFKRIAALREKIQQRKRKRKRRK